MGIAFPPGWVDEGPTSLTSFGMIADPLAPEKCIGDALVNNGTEAPKQYLPAIEVRLLSSATGGLLPTDTTSTAMRTIFPRPPPSWTLGDKTKKIISRTNFN